MEAAFQSTGHIDLHHGFRAISVDVITDYSFDNSYGFLDREDFGVQFFNMIRDFGPAFWFFQQFPAVQPIALSTPFWMAKLTSGALTRMMLHHEVCLIIFFFFFLDDGCSSLILAGMPSTNSASQGFRRHRKGTL